MKRQTIRFSEEAYQRLLLMRGKQSIEQGKLVSLNEVVNNLIIAADAAKGENENEQRTGSIQ